MKRMSVSNVDQPQSAVVDAEPGTSHVRSTRPEDTQTGKTMTLQNPVGRSATAENAEPSALTRVLKRLKASPSARRRSISVPTEPGEIPVKSVPAPRRRPTGRQVIRDAVGRALLRDRSLRIDSPDDGDWPGPHPATHLLEPLLRDARLGDGQVIVVAATVERRKSLLLELNAVQIDDWSFTVGCFNPVDDYLCSERLELLRGIQARLVALPLETESVPDQGAARARRSRRNNTSPLARRLSEQPNLAFPTTGESDSLFDAASELMTGDGRLELLPASVSTRTRGWASVDLEECPGTECPRFQECPAQRDRRAALESTVIVTGYSGLLELADAARSGSASGLQHRVVVLLEAHAAVDEVRREQTWEVALELLRPIQLLLTICGAMEENRSLWRAALAFFAGLADLRRSARYHRRIAEPGTIDASGLVQCLETAASSLQIAGTGSTELEAMFKTASAQALKMAERLMSASRLSDNNRAVWLDLDATGQGVIVSEPVRVSLDVTGSARCVIAHSACATAYPPNPAWEALGVDGSWEDVTIRLKRSESPRVLLVVPESTPDTAEQSWAGVVASRFFEVLRLGGVHTEGRFASSQVVTLLQDSARRMMVSLPLTSRVTGDWTELTFDPATQETGEPTRFVADNRLKCLVVDRLPFAATNRAWIDKLRETDASVFEREVLPRAITAFRQALRSVLRSGARRVVVVVFDRRVLSRAYGQHFVECLPNPGLTRNLEDMAVFLRGKEARR